MRGHGTLLGTNFREIRESPLSDISCIGNQSQESVNYSCITRENFLEVLVRQFDLGKRGSLSAARVSGAMGCGASSSAALPVEPKTEKIDKRPPSPPPDLELPPADLDSVKESPDINDASGSESEDDEPLVVWPEGKKPIVDGRLYGKQFAPPPPKPGASLFRSLPVH